MFNVPEYIVYGVDTDTPRITCKFENWLEILVEWGDIWTGVQGGTVRTPFGAVWQRAVDPPRERKSFTDEAGNPWDSIFDGPPEPWQ